MIQATKEDADRFIAEIRHEREIYKERMMKLEAEIDKIVNICRLKKD